MTGQRGSSAYPMAAGTWPDYRCRSVTVSQGLLDGRPPPWLLRTRSDIDNAGPRNQRRRKEMSQLDVNPPAARLASASRDIRPLEHQTPRAHHQRRIPKAGCEHPGDGRTTTSPNPRHWLAQMPDIASGRVIKPGAVADRPARRPSATARNIPAAIRGNGDNEAPPRLHRAGHLRDKAPEG